MNRNEVCSMLYLTNTYRAYEIIYTSFFLIEGRKVSNSRTDSGAPLEHQDSFDFNHDHCHLDLYHSCKSLRANCLEAVRSFVILTESLFQFKEVKENIFLREIFRCHYSNSKEKQVKSHRRQSQVRLVEIIS